MSNSRSPFAGGKQTPALVSRFGPGYFLLPALPKFTARLLAHFRAFYTLEIGTQDFDKSPRNIVSDYLLETGTCDKSGVFVCGMQAVTTIRHIVVKFVAPGFRATAIVGEQQRSDRKSVV